ncbi:MAG: LysR family transcriptional regulator [Azoarcus sp.]|jgi:DNA-binding transcriptional LysR family regulator|nr:LysR family transcriptional regulator [Azoarcus sp.]
MHQGIKHIRAFLAIARLGSFTHSASELHISQPALTVQIKQLEESLGVRLFDRNKRQVVLTQTGRDLLPLLERVLIDMESVLRISRDLVCMKCGSVTTAALPTVAAGLLPVAIQRFAAGYPAVSISVIDAIAERILHAVKSEEVDFGIGSRMGLDKDVEFEDLLVDRLSVFFPDGHPLTGRSRLTLRDVVAYPLIMPCRGTSVRSLFDRAVEKAALEVRLICESVYMSTAIGMVRAGLGVSILPEAAIHATACNGMHMTVINDPGLVRRIGIIRKRNRSLSPAAECFMKALREAAQVPVRHFTSAAISPKPSLEAT